MNPIKPFTLSVWSSGLRTLPSIVKANWLAWASAAFSGRLIFSLLGPPCVGAATSWLLDVAMLRDAIDSVQVIQIQDNADPNLQLKKLLSHDLSIHRRKVALYRNNANILKIKINVADPQIRELISDSLQIQRSPQKISPAKHLNFQIKPLQSPLIAPQSCFVRLR